MNQLIAASMFALLLMSSLSAEEIGYSAGIIKPKIKTLYLDGKIDTSTTLSMTICNDADIAGKADLQIEGNGFYSSPKSLTTSQIDAHNCVNEQVILTKAVDNYCTNLTVTASSRENVDTNKIRVCTSIGKTATNSGLCILPTALISLFVTSAFVAHKQRK